MALTRVSPALFQVSNNITSVTVGGSANTISLTFDSNGVITSATNNAVSVANTKITGNIISSQIASVNGSVITANTIANSAIQTGAVENYMNAAGLGFGMRNRIINGAMVIDQRNAGASYTQVNTIYSLDRWAGNSFDGGAAVNKFSVIQSSTAPTGFSNSLLVTSLAATASAASNIFNIEQRIEGFNFADFMYGTANAQTLTLSFWVRSSLTGTFGGALKNSARNRAYPFTYTISTANTFEQKTITITGDTSGTWIGATSGVGLWISFGLGVGSTYSGTAGAWGAGDLFSATGATSVVGTNGATFYITGVQLEKGSTATSFDYRDYGRELIMCQRYYQLADGFNGIGASNGTTMYSTMQFRTEMRASPSVSANANIQITYPGVNDYTQSSPSVSIIAGRVSTKGIQVNVNNFTGVTSLSPLSHNVGVNSASITLSAEL